MKTLNEHEEFYIRICSVAEKLLDKIEAKLDKGEQISVEAVADMSKAVSNMMKAEAKTIWGMRRHGNGETL
mgnify:CR=1 FL=1